VNHVRAALAASLLALLFAAGPAAEAFAARPASTLRVFAAASLADAFRELADGFEKSHAGASVQLNLAGSQQLASQLEHGAAADVFASADERWMAHVRERGLLAGEASVFARNRLVVIVPRSNPARIGRLQDLARRGVKLVLGAEAVPVGRYAREMLENLARAEGFERDYARRTLANVVSAEENVKSVVGKVQLGEADAGIVYRSDVSPALARYVRSFEIPDSANVLASYSIGVLRGAPLPGPAAEFVALVLSPAGQRVLERRGLIAVGAAAP
jgi:molybdate transport system substrate-binding protein